MLSLLKGLRVVDLSTIVLGPYATQFLGDFGADVIKVEAQGGDVFRAVRPGRTDDLGVGFLNFNRNKRSIAVDLKQPEGKEILHKLVAQADVLVHNMRGKSAQDLGADYATLKAINPKLVYCAAPGLRAPAQMLNRLLMMTLFKPVLGWHHSTLMLTVHLNLSAP